MINANSFFCSQAKGAAMPASANMNIDRIAQFVLAQILRTLPPGGEMRWRTTKLGLVLAASHLQWGDAHRKRRSRPRLAYPQR